MEKKLREEAASSVERGGTVYSKRLFNPEMDSNQIELNDPEFWEKMLQHPCMFRCPRHYCCICKAPANNQVLQVCVKCSHAYHANCLKTVPHTPLVKKYLICGDHPAVVEKKRERKRKEEAPRKRRKGA